MASGNHGVTSFFVAALAALTGCSDGGSSWPELAAIPLTNPDGAFWGPMMKVGGQSFLVDLDTGSSTTAIAGASCTSCASVGVSPLYTPGSAAKDQKLSAMATYGDMSGWSGEIYTDTVSLGQGTPSFSLALVDISDNLKQFFFDPNSYQGILGLGAPDNALLHTDAYFGVAEQNGATPTMAFELCDSDGTMWLGGFDATKAASAPVYTPMLPISRSQPFYAVEITSMSLGSTTVARSVDFPSASGPPIVDTGTLLFYAPDAVVTSSLATVNNAPGFKALFGPSAQLATLDSPTDMGCVTQAGVTAAKIDAMLPPLTFSFPSPTAGAPDVSVTVAPSSSYMLDSGDGTWCFGITERDDDTTILGDAILRAFVTIVDVESRQVGWAPDQGCAQAQRRAIDRTVLDPHKPHRPHRR